MTRPAIGPRAITGRAIAAWLALCIITAVLLGPLRHSAPGPQSFDENGLRVLIDRFGPSAPLLWLVRLVASTAAAAHLGLLTLGLGARCIGAVNLVRLLDRISPSIIRRLLTPLTVASLTASMTLSTMPGASASTPSPPPPAVMVVAAPAASTSAASASPTTRLAPATIEVDSTVTPPDTPTIGGTVVVARGDSLWSIAEDTLHAHFGRPPTSRETSQYWRALIEANRDRLRDHDDPSLIFAGQQFVLP
ncbi:MAG: LysM peptidoglycan-binding domain-containing protein [Acidimicrobiia bacterium]